MTSIVQFDVDGIWLLLFGVTMFMYSMFQIFTRD